MEASTMNATPQATARSLWIIYQQMPDAVQQEFKRLLAEDADDVGWMKLTEEALREDWEAPENDIWDELYAKRNV